MLKPIWGYGLHIRGCVKKTKDTEQHSKISIESAKIDEVK